MNTSELLQGHPRSRGTDRYTITLRPDGKPTLLCLQGGEYYMDKL